MDGTRKSMENSRIIALMAKKTGKSASPEELEELDGLLRNHPEHAYLNEVLYALKGNEDHLELVTPKEELVDHGWQNLIDKMKQDHNRKGILRSIPGRSRWVAAAAILVVLAGAGTVTYKKVFGRAPGAIAKVQDHSTRIATAGVGATTQLILSDGTRVRLNAGSKLTYPAVFSGSTREVLLEGEAFFDVASDQRAPFRVHAGKITVGVLGTTFNVKAYLEDSNIETTLISGKVQVILDNEPEKPILLSPHEKLTIVNVREAAGAGPDKNMPAAARSFNALRYQVQTLPRDSGNNFVETAWLINRLVINNESFETVAHMLERRYGVSIRFRDENLLREHISGVFEKEGIDQVLDILQMTTGFSYRIEGKTIILWKR